MTEFDSHGPHGASDARGQGGPDFDGECERIEAALAESERGRRFLAAYAHRHRGADTRTLLQAIGRLESAVTRENPGKNSGKTVEEARDECAVLAFMAEAVAAARAEMEGAGTSGSFEAVVQAAETTTSAILAAAESVQEAAWTLRETGVDERLCDLLDRRASAIGTACAAQDRITQASLGIARTLSLLETRLAATHHAPGTHASGLYDPAPSPIPAEDEIDFVATGVSAEGPAVEARPSVQAGAFVTGTATDTAAQDDLATAFADLDRLSIEEKIALFS